MKQENLNSDMADHSLAILLFMDFFKTILLKKKKKKLACESIVAGRKNVINAKFIVLRLDIIRQIIFLLSHKAIHFDTTTN